MVLRLLSGGRFFTLVLAASLSLLCLVLLLWQLSGLCTRLALGMFFPVRIVHYSLDLLFGTETGVR